MSAERPASLPAPLPGPPPGRFLVLLACCLVAGCAGYAALVLQTATGAGVLALRSTYPYAAEWGGRSYSAAEVAGLRWLLRGLAFGAAGVAGGLAASAAGRGELLALGREVRGVGRGLRAGWRALAPRQRRLAGAGLLGLTLLRAGLSLLVQPYDDATSYELFVREPLLTVSAVYALPNNHVLSNTLAWGFYQVYPGFWWSMRLPVLLTSTAATVGWFLVLLRRATFGVALGAVGWFGLLGQSLYYAATGRGYWLLAGLGGVGFAALLALGAGASSSAPAGPPRARAAGLALVLTGVLGLYTVPTHALFLASAYGWLGLQAGRPRAGAHLRHLAALGSLTLLGAGLLYAPLLLLSGPQLLLHNPYVHTLPAAEFWRTLPAALRVPHHLLNLPLVLLVLAGFGRLRRRARAGRLPPGLARLVAQLGGLSGWFFALPYVLAAALLVQPPERTLFYKAQYLFILVGLLVEWARASRLAGTHRGRRGLAVALVGGTCLFASSQLWQVQRQEALWRRSWRWQLGAPVVDWLATQPVAPVLAPGPYHCLVLRFYAHSAHRGRVWQIDSTPRRGVHYRYLVRPPGAPAAPGVVGFGNELMVVALASAASAAAGISPPPAASATSGVR